MVPHDRLSPGYWYVKSDNLKSFPKGFEIVELTLIGDKLFVFVFGLEIEMNFSNLQFIGPVADPYLGKWDNV